VSNNGPLCPCHHKQLSLVTTNSGEPHHECTQRGCTIRWNPGCALFYLTDSENWALEKPSDFACRLVPVFQTEPRFGSNRARRPKLAPANEARRVAYPLVSGFSRVRVRVKLTAPSTREENLRGGNCDSENPLQNEKDPLQDPAPWRRRAWQERSRNARRKRSCDIFGSCPSGGTGRRRRLKIFRPPGLGGSSPSSGTNLYSIQA
jgi:hypothetical protein